MYEDGGVVTKLWRRSKLDRGQKSWLYPINAVMFNQNGT